MHSITVRGLDSHTKTLLRLRAAQHGCSMEQEVRHILQQALQSTDTAPGLNFAQRVQQRFQGAALDDLSLPPRQQSRAAPPLEP
jgi:plasmid stability protein